MRLLLGIVVWLVSSQVFAGAGMHMPMKLNKINLEKLEIQSEDSYRIDLSGWYGTELRRLTWSTEAQVIDDQYSTEFSLGYTYATDAFWDSGPVLALKREDDDLHTKNETWLGWQFKGTAPYFIHVDAKTLIGESEQFKVEVKLEHEFPLSRDWLLATHVELEAGRFEEDGEYDLEFESSQIGWRLKYETVQRFSYYIGAEYADLHIPDTNQWRAVAGLSWWW